MDNNEKAWNSKAAAAFVGRTIVSAKYMSEEDAAENGWYSRPLVITFNDGSTIYPMQDDEGNDGGALAGSNYMFPTL